MRKALLAATALLITVASLPDDAFAQRGARGFGGRGVMMGGFRGGGYAGYRGGFYRGGAIGYRGGLYRGAAIGYRGGLYRTAGWGWRGRWPIAAGLAIGALGYGYGYYGGYPYYGYGYGSYPYNSCTAWDGYQWVNICY